MQMPMVMEVVIMPEPWQPSSQVPRRKTNGVDIKAGVSVDQIAAAAAGGGHDLHHSK